LRIRDYEKQSNRLLCTLYRLRLTNIKVVIKTLGAGFHQQVDGLHHLTLVLCYYYY